MAGQKDTKDVKEKTGSEESPVKRTPRKSTASPRVAKVDTNVPLILESRQLVHSRISQVGDEVIFVVAENYPPKGGALLPKGTLVVGKIAVIERMQKDQAGGIRISLDTVLSPSGAAIPMNGTLEVIRQKGQDNLGGKEVFIPVGLRQPANITKKFSGRVNPRPLRNKPPKGLLMAPAEIDDGEITIKIADLKYPTRLDVAVEGPQGIEATDLKEDSLKIVRINDFILPRPLTPLDEKIKVADRNKNKVKDISYKFAGWDLVRYLPEGTSTLVLNAQTKDGKPVELTATVKTEYK